jgi:dihydrofolate reductase
LHTGEQEPHGFKEFLASVDVVVLSGRPIDFSSVNSGVVEQMSGEPGEIVTRLEVSGFTHAYVDGGVTIQRFLAAGLIDELTVTRVPVLIGTGIPLFGPLPHDVILRHIATRCYNGLVQSQYEIDAAHPKPQF